MADLLALAIRRSHHPDGLSGYVGFTERYAVWNDVNKALAEEDDFRGATAKAWFAVGYLSGLLDPEGPADGFGAADETPAAEDLAVLLQWLRHVHDGASDSAVVDTPSVLEHFKGKAAASLVGRQFREPVDPGPGRSAWEVLPPLEIDAAEVARISLAARQFVTPAAYALGQAHGRLQPT
ncbi:MAG: hypothetical protein HC783_02945 [Rhodobacteraceae bacterium]|nr:hypothetical protein [Paracoccaceae bacterium]